MPHDHITLVLNIALSILFIIASSHSKQLLFNKSTLKGTVFCECGSITHFWGNNLIPTVDMCLCKVWRRRQDKTPQRQNHVLYVLL